MELDFTKEILAKIIKECGNEEEMSHEAWASEKNKGKTLNKPFRTSGGPKKFSVYVKNEKGNVVKVNFGDPNMEIKRDDPARRKSFRARHNCDNPGPKTKAKYWSCKMWSKKSVTKVTKGEEGFEKEMVEFLDESESALTEKQKSCPQPSNNLFLKSRAVKILRIKILRIKTPKKIKKRVKKSLMPKKVFGKIFTTRKNAKEKIISQPSQAIKITQIPKL